MPRSNHGRGWLIAVLATAALACGEGTDPTTGTGGLPIGGGAGGSGGSGGGGETGGSGGAGGLPAPSCGDGQLEGEESCDDGNTMAGDGCSASCFTEGVCTAPLEFMDYARQNGGQFDVHGIFPQRDGKLESSCGGEGSDLVYRYRPPASGTLQVVVSGLDGAVRAYVRTSCEDAAAELSCAPAGQIRSFEVPAQQDLYLVVDGGSTSEPTPFVLSVAFIAYRLEGETCGAPARRCAPGLLCRDDRCEVDSPPNMTNPIAFRAGPTGADLAIVANGDDVNANTTAFALRFLDPEGVPTDLALVGDPRWDTESHTWIAAFTGNDPSPVGEVFQGWTVLPGFLDEHPEVASIGIALRDQNGQSPEVVVPLQEQPVRQEGEPCAAPTPLDRCAGEMVCRAAIEGTAPSCGHLAALREEACALAPVITGAAELVGDTTASNLWNAPTGCWETALVEEDKPEALVRLHLDELAPLLRISTDRRATKGEMLLYVFEGCGSVAEPLACDHRKDRVQQTGKASELVLTNVPAGDYLIVIDSVVPWGRPFGLGVTLE